MDDILDELNARAEEIPVPLEPANEDHLVEVEEQILLPLPRAYREFLLETSHLIVGSIEPATVSEPNSHTYLPELCATAWAEGLPRYLIPVCANAEGYYCIDPDGIVSAWPLESKTKEWESIWDWARDVWLQGRV